MSGDNSLIRLKLPEQDLRALTIGSDQPRKLQTWVDQLPLMNMGETSRQLYQYLQELNRLQLDTRTRLQLLEIVRPAVLHVCDSLGKHYLKQSLVLPEKARRVASLAQALQGHLASGYKLVVARGVARIQRMQQDGERERPQDREIRLAIATALERAVAALGDTLLRCYQLYFPTPRHLWLELHQLYLLASTCQLALLPVPDPMLRHLPAITVAQAYCRTLLLATAKPNQLRQQELAWIYDATEAWSVLMAVRPAASRDDLFVFDLLLDRPPTYRTHVSAARDSSRYIDSQALVAQLTQCVNGSPPEDFLLPRGASDGLLAHLQQAWGALTERSFQRQDQQIRLEICFGIGAVHHFSSHGVDFATQIGAAQLRVLAGEDNNPFSGQVRRNAGAGMRPALPEEGWDQSFDGGSRRMAHELQGNQVESIDLSRITAAVQAYGTEVKAVQFDRHSCQTVNVSPGGYCLAWQGETPAQLRTGELVGVHEEEHHDWTVGVIRWVRQLTHQGAQFGIELLAPRALPAAARVLKKTGDSGEFLRVLLLPELHAIAQPATLLVPAVGFSSGSRVELLRQGAAERVQLLRRVSSTGSFGQFEFRSLDAPVAAPADDEFQSIWSSL
ncbi:hypothetical protein S7S_15855 [Isoalcanivorax pacificus W11-5]|uniref:Molecular chaperone n=1 Tax=Isoalcanivorax pacificus W11-5 TaxID=391936 RepID=A0A0B4XSY6_9GAMM|nr:hypothetical protein [Isoalcanivorax pacificus]AJD49583.1 hypothetical protein S7S_15855 [Isoalcanivorax pacificus W11-5]